MSASTNTKADWSVLEIDGVMGVCENAARQVSRNYGGAEYDDVLQDAYLIVATKHNVAALLEEFDSPLGILMHRLTQDLINKVTPESKRRSRTVSYDALLDRAAPEKE